MTVQWTGFSVYVTFQLWQAPSASRFALRENAVAVNPTYDPSKNLRACAFFEGSRLLDGPRAPSTVWRPVGSNSVVCQRNATKLDLRHPDGHRARRKAT